MTTNLDDARRAYEAAKLLKDNITANAALYQAAAILFTNASQDYAQALTDDAQRKLDAMGVVIGETVVHAPEFADDIDPFVITRLDADVHVGNVQVGGSGFALWMPSIRPYVALVVKEMVLGSSLCLGWSEYTQRRDKFRLTLSNVTHADLDAMKPGDVIEGSYKIQRMK